MQNMQRVSVSLLKEIVQDLKKNVIESFITHISLISSEDIIFTFSFYKKEKLLISMNHHHPFLSLIDSKENFPTLLNNMNDIFRKEIGGAYIRDISLKDNDRVVTFMLQKSNDYFEKVTYYLVLELIPHRPNILLLDEEKKILFASHYTPMNVARVIIKGMKYEELPSMERSIEEEYDLSLFKKEALNYLEEAKNKRRKDKYDHLFTHVKSKIKSLNKKLELFNQTIINSEKDLSYKDMGDLCYILENDISLLDEYLNDGLLKNYDSSLSPTDNASIYFKKYKKAKSSIAHAKEEIIKTKDDIVYYERILFQLENGNDEDLEEIATILHPQKGHKETRTRPNNKKKKISPYYININDTRIGFGKTDEQNNILTFSKALPNHEYFHIANYSGSHVVILKDNPSDEERLIAAELALILSKKEDGDVYTTKIKNVKKGDHLGLVNLKSHTLIHLEKVREKTKELLINAKKMN